jgi:5-(carboxyamino)imidazole ribonucleotide synthase
MPLGDTSARGLSAMFNWIGELPDAAPVLEAVDAHWHDYGKQPRVGRKVGHATVCAPNAGQLVERLGGIAHALGRDQQADPAVGKLMEKQ